MASRPLGELAGTIEADVAAIIGDISRLAKAELGREGARIGLALGAFLAAAVGVACAVVLLSIVVAQVLIAVGLAPWAAYLIDVGIVLVFVAGLALVGKTLFSRLKGPVRTLHAIRNLASAIGGHHGDDCEHGPDGADT
ncbi:MAG: phage holin family protein [Bifidobacteriaceae bacterium]|jgi:purine-cytosine permease-like protein|nr:phage holin family protein [Bifidobacteriaceae bacterium]